MHYVAITIGSLLYYIIIIIMHSPVEVANSLNPPEGYLVQGRNGTEDDSEIVGTFLVPSIVSSRNPNIPVNYKILQCRHYQYADPQLYPVRLW